MPNATPDSQSEQRRKPDPIRPDWISKTLAGLLLGLGLAISCSGLLAAVLTGMPLPVSGQLVMWLLPPIWLGTLALVYFFSSGLRAWAWLGLANVLALGAWWLARSWSLT